MPESSILCKGMVDRIGSKDSMISYQKGEQPAISTRTIIDNHKTGLQLIVDRILDPINGAVRNKEEINVVGHRVVHGGSSFTDPVLITDQVKDQIKELFTLAPLHNPANYEGIRVAEALFPEAEQIAIFDTAFHQTLPQKAYQYAIPVDYLTKEKIRVYGFHGTSHKYVSDIVRKKSGGCNKLITIHLGNGCSMSAIKNGKCIDTSLGFAPMNGLIMGTRCGDIDQSVVLYLMQSLHKTAAEVNDLLQRQSGMLGLTGHSDLRDIEQKAAAGDRNCQLALEMNAYRIKKYIGSYSAVLNGLDAIVFTAGIGENSATMRHLVCSEMDFFGIRLDAAKNEIRSSSARTIHEANATTQIWVIPTDEELEIARQAYSLLQQNTL